MKITQVPFDDDLAGVELGGADSVRPAGNRGSGNQDRGGPQAAATHGTPVLLASTAQVAEALGGESRHLVRGFTRRLTPAGRISRCWPATPLRIGGTWRLRLSR